MSLCFHFSIPCSTFRPHKHLPSHSRCPLPSTQTQIPLSIPTCSLQLPTPTRIKTSRRNLLQLILTLTATLPLSTTLKPLHSLETLPKLSPPPENETDENVGYTFRPPKGWKRTIGSLSGGRALIAYSPPQTNPASVIDKDNDVYASITAVGTPISADFRKLGSFGGAESVANTLVPKDSGGKVLGVKEDTERNAYIVYYRLKKGGDDGSWMRLLTVFSLIPSRYIVTVTAQAREDKWGEVEEDMRKCVDSFRLL